MAMRRVLSLIVLFHLMVAFVGTQVRVIRPNYSAI